MNQTSNSQLQTIHAAFAAKVDAVLSALEAEGALPAGISRANVTVEPPRDPAHGDLATNAAMVLAKPAATNPRALAEQVVEKLAADPLVTGAEIAGPGFINLRVAREAWLAELRAMETLGADYGKSGHGRGAHGQCRICLGQSHRADAHGPLPGRGGWRCARQPAGIFRPQGDPRILCQRCGGQVDVLARSAHSALPRGAGRTASARFPKGSIRAITCSGGQGAGRGIRRQIRQGAGKRMAFPVQGPRFGRDDGDDPRRSRAARHRA
jgi:arginyl-tRNA synthetase